MMLTTAPGQGCEQSARQAFASWYRHFSGSSFVAGRWCFRGPLSCDRSVIREHCRGAAVRPRGRSCQMVEPRFHVDMDRLRRRAARQVERVSRTSPGSTGSCPRWRLSGRGGSLRPVVRAVSSLLKCLTASITVSAMKRSPASEAARLLGRLGGLKGGPARSAALTAARRSRIARIAARARWAK